MSAIFRATSGPGQSGDDPNLMPDVTPRAVEASPSSMMKCTASQTQLNPLGVHQSGP